MSPSTLSPYLVVACCVIVIFKKPVTVVLPEQVAGKDKYFGWE